MLIVILDSTITCPSCGTAKLENRRLPIFLRVHQLRSAVASESRPLLHILLLRKRSMPANSGKPAARTDAVIPRQPGRFPPTVSISTVYCELPVWGDTVEK
jgi:hypothetical protein